MLIKRCRPVAQVLDCEQFPTYRVLEPAELPPNLEYDRAIAAIDNIIFKVAMTDDPSADKTTPLTHSKRGSEVSSV